tara:strand:+ start:472 stop:1317 length:846 start_codon:yes stop_codon:yes gene_type:complete
MKLFQIDSPIQGTVIKRPSKVCKTPYVADVILENQTDEILGHSPALGCCGLADKEAVVILSPLNNKKTVCSHRIEIAKFEEKGHTIYIGINPKLAETSAFYALEKNYLPFLQNVQSFKREVTYLNSRFDFSGIDENGKTFYMEIKNVPLADYVDVPKKERKKFKKEIEEGIFDQKISYFPDGYRKNSTDVVSPRALKHIHELEEIVLTTEYRAILCFVVPRTDVKQFQPSNIDLTYKEAVQKAYKNGVEIRVLQVEWDQDGNAYYVNKHLPIVLFDEYGTY